MEMGLARRIEEHTGQGVLTGNTVIACLVIAKSSRTLWRHGRSYSHEYAALVMRISIDRSRPRSDKHEASNAYLREP